MPGPKDHCPLAGFMWYPWLWSCWCSIPKQMYQHRLPWIQRGQVPTHTKHINIHLHLALLSEYKVIIDSTGIGVFCICYKAGKGMRVSSRSLIKKRKRLLNSTRRCWGDVPSGKWWVNIVGFSHMWFYTVFMLSCNTWIFNYTYKILKGN